MRWCVGILVALLWTTPALATHSNTNSRHWSGAGERIVPVNDCVTNLTMDSYLRSATAEWSKSPHLNLPVVTRPCSDPYKIKVLQVYKPDWGYTAYTYHSGIPHFRWSRVELNAAKSGGRSLWTMCHEIGHALGLAHRRSLSSCMTTGSTARELGGSARPYPDAHDYEQLRAIYSHSP